MENISPEMIWTMVLAVASAVVMLSGAIEKIVKAVKAAKAPNDAQNKRLDELEDWRKGVDRILAADKTHLDCIDEGNRVTQRAILALLDHSIDGNNIDQMKHAKEELQNHLINR